MSCAETILSNDTYDFIVASDETNTPLIAPVCVQRINGQYEVWYYDGSSVPPLSVGDYSYASIPKCFTLMDSTSLDVSGILAIQNQPTLSLKGQGVFVGIIDTGIDYTNDLFIDGAGNSRIYSIWDQGALPDLQRQVESTTGNENTNLTRSPEGFIYGVEYTNEQINRALQSVNPLEIVPEQDTNGHGTFVASLAAGREDMNNDFIGAAPFSELIVVKLKEAKQNLREFFYLSEQEPIYQENDIMAAVAYLHAVAMRENRPIAIYIGLGSNQGSRTGMDPLSFYLNTIGIQRGRAIVVPAGNEAIARHHFYGIASSTLAPVAVEVNVEENVDGFCMELWSYAPELVRVVVQSPTGQRSTGNFPIAEETQTTNFVFENTLLTLDYRIAGRGSGDLLVFFRFSRPTAGIWTVFVYPQQSITGRFHMWLPIQPQIGADVTFISPNPDTTITTPGASVVSITAGGYNALTEARYIASGRGFSASGYIKPEFCAPCEEVSGAGLRNNYVTYTGTSVAAAITTGAAALCLEWGLLRGNIISMNCVDVKNLLIRGCNRDENIIYPNPEWGYGKLDVYRAFEVLRE